MTCPDFVPDFGELKPFDFGFFVRGHYRVHPEVPWDQCFCIRSAAALDQEFASTEEFLRVYQAAPVIVGTWSRSAWWDEADAVSRTPNAKGWAGVDAAVVHALKCDHLQVSPRPGFRWADCPWWLNCLDCHHSLITVLILECGVRCKRCRRELTAESMYNRSLLFTDQLLIAAVCQPCARVFDRAGPPLPNGPAVEPGTALYAARVWDSGMAPEELLAELTAAGIAHPKKAR